MKLLIAFAGLIAVAFGQAQVCCMDADNCCDCDETCSDPMIGSHFNVEPNECHSHCERMNQDPNQPDCLYWAEHERDLECRLYGSCNNPTPGDGHWHLNSMTCSRGKKN